ncbi:hypothetical protein TRIATDRAFT_297842, partial [Trichoderma atroviride IMI 206040]
MCSIAEYGHVLCQASIDSQHLRKSPYSRKTSRARHPMLSLSLLLRARTCQSIMASLPRSVALITSITHRG